MLHQCFERFGIGIHIRFGKYGQHGKRFAFLILCSWESIRVGLNPVGYVGRIRRFKGPEPKNAYMHVLLSGPIDQAVYQGEIKRSFPWLDQLPKYGCQNRVYMFLL